MHFIRPSDKPAYRLASYYKPQCLIKNGTDKRIRETYGGDRTDYIGAVTTNTASMETVMVLLNATLSEPNARFTTADIKDFFLMSYLERQSTCGSRFPKYLPAYKMPILGELW